MARPATVHAAGLAVIAAIYIGFAVADGRARWVVAAIIALEIAAGVRFRSWPAPERGEDL